MEKKIAKAKTVTKQKLPKARSVKFEDWPEESKRILRENEKSQRITQADLKTIINT